jgi:hypothetical protein
MAVIPMVITVWVIVAIFGRIASRAGYSRWWALTMLVPILNLVMLWVFAFTMWPVTKPRGQA